MTATKVKRTPTDAAWQDFIRITIGFDTIANSTDATFGDVPDDVWDKATESVTFFYPDMDQATAIQFSKDVAAKIRAGVALRKVSHILRFQGK